MENQALTQELIGLEKKYWQAMQDHDLDAALELTDFPCLVAGEHGMQLVDKDAYVKMFESQKGNDMQIEFKGEPQCRLLGPDTAVIAYEIEGEMTMQGKTEHVNAVDTSTWVRKDGKWTCGLHTETPIHKH